MKPHELVPTLETCQQLKPAGFPQDTYFAWVYPLGADHKAARVLIHDWNGEGSVLDAYTDPVAAPTLVEILDRLPEYLALKALPTSESKVVDFWLAVDPGVATTVSYHHSDEMGFDLTKLGHTHENPAEAAAQLWLALQNERPEALEGTGE